MDMRIRFIFLFFVSLLSASTLAGASQGTVPVSGFARSFITGTAINDATITVLETGMKVKTDKDGHYGPFDYPIGKALTLQIEKSGYSTTQSETVIVPSEGLTDKYNNITFQIPESATYSLLAWIIGANPDDNNCHVTTTITDYHKTMDDLPQGLEGVQVTLFPNIHEKPFYFDIFKSGPLKGRTNPFSKGLTETSEDGGVAFFNLPPLDKPYTLSAQKDGRTFTEIQFMCRKGAFINISPPRGPMANKQDSEFAA